MRTTDPFGKNQAIGILRRTTRHTCRFADTYSTRQHHTGCRIVISLAATRQILPRTRHDTPVVICRD